MAMRKGTLEQTDSGPKLALNSNIFDLFKSIPGSPSYWRSFRSETFARMTQLGPFQLFFTLSCGEARWPEVYTSILQDKGCEIKYKDENDWDGTFESITVYDPNRCPEGLNLAEYKNRFIKNISEFMKDHFVLVTRIFDERVKSFIQKILFANKVENYSYRVEFQQRGMPHIHGVLWLKESLIKDIINENKQFDLEKVDENGNNLFIKFVDEWTTCRLPKDNIELRNQVLAVNTHLKCTASCKKKSNKCRFNFPRFPCKKTIIAKPLDSNLTEEEKTVKVEKAKVNLKIVKENLDKLTEEDDAFYENMEFDDSIHYFIENVCGIPYAEYEQALSISERGNIIILKRNVTERMVNNYNPVILKSWDANIDIQVCADNFAVITYITDYITKGDKGFTPLLKKAITETKGMSKKDRLNYVKKLYFTYKEVCVAEAAYRLIPSLTLKRSDKFTKFLQTGFKENRSCLPKKANEEDAEEKEIFEIEQREGQFYKPTSIHDQYSARPEGLEDICLAQFTACYKVCAEIGEEFFEENGEVSELKGNSTIFSSDTALPKYIKLSTLENTYMQLRQSPIIVRIHASKNKDDPHEQIFSELQLFYPWRDEENDIYSNDSMKCKEVFLNNKELIDINRQKMYPFSKAIEILSEWVNNDFERPAHLFEGIDQIAQQENDECNEEMEPLDLSELPDENENEKPTINVKKNSANLKESVKIKPIILDDPDVMAKYAQSLSYEQKVVFNEFINYCKACLVNANNGNFIVIPPTFIVTGNN